MNLDSSLSERPKRGTNEAATCRHTANSERGATEESGLRENRTSRLIERTVEGQTELDHFRLYTQERDGKHKVSDRCFEQRRWRVQKARWRGKSPYSVVNVRAMGNAEIS